MDVLIKYFVSDFYYSVGKKNKYLGHPATLYSIYDYYSGLLVSHLMTSTLRRATLVSPPPPSPLPLPHLLF